MLDWGGCNMVTYEDLMKLPNHRQSDSIYCAMCGNAIWQVDYENKTYNYCGKCKTIKLVFCLDKDVSLLPPTYIRFKFWSNEDD